MAMARLVQKYRRLDHEEARKLLNWYDGTLSVVVLSMLISDP
jgi:hypothetical protein